MMRKGVDIKAVLAGLRHISTDQEGSLYETRNGNGTYLYVKCPSTGQEYLLGVPSSLRSPAIARRWTFNITSDAKFVREA